MDFFKAMGSGTRRAMLTWHRRAGKDTTAWNWVILEACRVTGVYYYFFPSYAQGKKAWWDGKDKTGKRYLDYIPFIKDCRLNETELKITLPKIQGGSQGSIIQIIGTDNFDSLMGTNPVGCVFSEYSLQHPAAWQYIRPILEENAGWAVFTQTPRGENHGKKLYDAAKKSDKWYCSLLTIKDTTDKFGQPIITEDQIIQMRDEGEDEDIIQQEWYCSFNGATQGSFFSKQMRQLVAEGRLTSVPHNPQYPVYVYFDIGHSDHTVAIFAQFVGDNIHIIRVIAEAEQDLKYFAGQINQCAREYGYSYGGFYWPHDMNITEWGSGERRLTMAKKLGLRPSHVVPKHALYEGIDSIRRKFNQFKIDEHNCEDLSGALWLYRKTWDIENKVFLVKPVHDWSSHYCDALRQLCMAKKPSNRVPGSFSSAVADEAIYAFDPLGRDENEYGDHPFQAGAPRAKAGSDYY